jgi:hypothetical protein
MPRAGATRDGEGAVARRGSFDFGTGRGAPRFLLVGSTLVQRGLPFGDAAGERPLPSWGIRGLTPAFFFE